MVTTPTSALHGDNVRCLFTKPTMLAAEIRENLSAGWPADQVPDLLHELLHSGLIEPSPCSRHHYRLKSDMPVVDWNTLLYQSNLPTPLAQQPTPLEPSADSQITRFSLFRGGIKSVKPSGTLTPAELYDELVSGRLRVQTEQLRAIGRSSPTYGGLKNKLDYVTPGGQFTHRAESGLVARSGLIVLDFDKLPNVAAARAALLADPKLAPSVELLFTSPSGDGLKCLLSIDSRHSHLENFNGLTRYLTHRYAELGLVPDKACKEVSRACYLAHDPNAYLNPTHKTSSKLAA